MRLLMSLRVIPVLALLTLVSAACGGATLEEPAAMPPEMVVRTGDFIERGLDETDFPRVQQIADGVYTYEQLDPPDFPGDRITTASMFVVTEEGVLVADGQRSVEETQRLIDTIAGITEQPITDVVICSDHGDHTGGNSAFPAGTAFLAHPTSRDSLAAGAKRPNRSADAPPEVMPSELVERGKVLQLGAVEVRILFLGRAHTGGDLVVHLPE